MGPSTTARLILSSNNKILPCLMQHLGIHMLKKKNTKKPVVYLEFKFNSALWIFPVKLQPCLCSTPNLLPFPSPPIPLLHNWIRGPVSPLQERKATEKAAHFFGLNQLLKVCGPTGHPPLWRGNAIQGEVRYSWPHPLLGLLPWES